MFLNITFESNTDIQNQANLYKFQDTIKTLLKEWNDNWYLYDEINRDVIFQNNQCERLTVTLNSDFQTFNILFEFDKYKNQIIKRKATFNINRDNKIECSALTGNNIGKVFNRAIEIVVNPPKDKKKKKKDCILL